MGEGCTRGAGFHSQRPGCSAVPTLCSERLLLEPLRVEHAAEMAVVLDDVALHTYIGGRPLDEQRLREQYRYQVRGGTADGRQRWFNWVVRRGGVATGYVQATLTTGATPAAEVAWVIGVAHQGRGYASEAARTMVAWLRCCADVGFVAHVHPGNAASVSVARGLGLVPTDTVVDGEIRWIEPPHR